MTPVRATGIDLRKEIRAIMDSTELTTPQEISDAVFRLINRDNAIDAVDQMLTGFVRGVINERRTVSGPKVPLEAIRSAGKTSRKPNQSNLPPAPSRSTKVTGIREGWQRYLDVRVHVEAGRWKFFKDLTEGDLRYAAKERRNNADRNLQEARRYEAWAQLVAEHDVATFKDLPIEVQMKAIGTVA